MGLDVIVFKVVMPKDVLDTVEKVSAFEGVSRSPRSSNGLNGRGPLYFHCQTKRKLP